MTAYYNEIDPFAAAWLRQLISAGHIAPGDVDERSIVDVRPDDLRKYTQCHFFAGIGVWSYALRRAGWSDDRPIWTGSCPCQPFSAAGKGAGFDDERHLWPSFFHLIRECGPSVVAGEQVASKDGLGWLDLVQADMEGTGYAFGAVDTCAAGVGAPHIRQRFYWLAEGLDHTASTRYVRAVGEPESLTRDETRLRVSGAGEQVGGLADEHGAGQRSDAGGELFNPSHNLEPRRSYGGVADADIINGDGARPCAGDDRREFSGSDSIQAIPSAFVRTDPGGMADGAGTAIDHRLCDVAPWTGPTNGLWRDADWLFCRDGKWRPVEPGTFPLAHGAAARVGRLRGYGNAINAEQATAFIEAYLETEADRCVRVEGAFA